MYQSEIMIAESSHNIDIAIAVVENGKGQDQPFHGETASGKRYFGVCDGHGTNSVIRELRNMMKNGRFADFMEETYPITKIADDLVERRICGMRESSGSTINLGILEGNTLKCMNAGDSVMFVFKNGLLVFKSLEHSASNIQEKNRLGNKVLYRPVSTIKVVSETEIINGHAEYVLLQGGTELAFTQALGHNNKAKPVPEVNEIIIDNADEIVVVCVTDGVTDMLIKNTDDTFREQDIRMVYELSAEELKNKIMERWLQLWDMTTSDGVTHKGCQYKKSECDDVGITRFVMKPRV
jgi:serine/threonine protein phosphatase PrpC